MKLKKNCLSLWFFFFFQHFLSLCGVFQQKLSFIKLKCWKRFLLNEIFIQKRVNIVYLSFLVHFFFLFYVNKGLSPDRDKSYFKILINDIFIRLCFLLTPYFKTWGNNLRINNECLLNGEVGKRKKNCFYRIISIAKIHQKILEYHTEFCY